MNLLKLFDANPTNQCKCSMHELQNNESSLGKKSNKWLCTYDLKRLRVSCPLRKNVERRDKIFVGLKALGCCWLSNRKVPKPPLMDDTAIHN